MKKYIQLLSFLLISGSVCAGNNNDSTKSGSGEATASETEVVIERDIMVSSSIRIVEDKAYLNVRIQNESVDGIYSMVRYNCDGSITSIGFRDAVPNTINQPLTYSFIDEELAQVETTYVLVRISHKPEVIQTWEYTPQTGAIVPGK